MKFYSVSRICLSFMHRPHSYALLRVNALLNSSALYGTYYYAPMHVYTNYPSHAILCMYINALLGIYAHLCIEVCTFMHLCTFMDQYIFMHIWCTDWLLCICESVLCTDAFIQFCANMPLNAKCTFIHAYYEPMQFLRIMDSYSLLCANTILCGMDSHMQNALVSITVHRCTLLHIHLPEIRFNLFLHMSTYVDNLRNLFQSITFFFMKNRKIRKKFH